MPGYIYLIMMADGVYKVGRTQQDYGLGLKRLRMYPADSQIILIQKTVEDVEREIIDIFKNEFGKHPRGTEYFQGDENRMIEIIHRAVSLPPASRLEKHPLKRFIDSSTVLDQSKYCPFNLFIALFNEWCQINQLGRIKFNENFYTDVFSLFNIRISIESFKYNESMYDCQPFIFGLDLS